MTVQFVASKGVGAKSGKVFKFNKKLSGEISIPKGLIPVAQAMFELQEFTIKQLAEKAVANGYDPKTKNEGGAVHMIQQRLGELKKIGLLEGYGEEDKAEETEEAEAA